MDFCSSFRVRVLVQGMEARCGTTGDGLVVFGVPSEGDTPTLFFESGMDDDVEVVVSVISGKNEAAVPATYQGVGREKSFPLAFVWAGDVNTVSIHVYATVDPEERSTRSRVEGGRGLVGIGVFVYGDTNVLEGDLKVTLSTPGSRRRR